MYHRFLLITLSVACTAFSRLPPHSSPITSRGISGSPQVAQAQSAPSALLRDYDRLMELGYEATQRRDYRVALEYFQQALAQRPGDYYASAAIRNLEGYLSQEAADDAAEQAASQQQMWLIISAVAIGGGVGGLLLFWSLRLTRSTQKSSNQPPQPVAASPAKSNPSRQQPQQSEQPIWVKPSQEETDLGEDFSPKQQTTRLADFDLSERLIEELYHSNLTKRRRAIQELGHSGDSRAIMPLIERIIDADAYEHSLILDALTRISARVLQPMNQALTTCLEDNNPQVRKNAIRDLTQLLYLMAQVSQLLTQAVDDSDAGVKQTAQWAISRLQVQELSPRFSH